MGTHWELAKQLRETCPHFYNAYDNGGYWVFTRHDAVRDIYKTPELFSSESITPWQPEPIYRFRHADVSNREYNPRGRYRGSDYRFPYPDGSFDAVTAKPARDRSGDLIADGVAQQGGVSGAGARLRADRPLDVRGVLLVVEIANILLGREAHHDA